jgi:hypothetical protein
MSVGSGASILHPGEVISRRGCTETAVGSPSWLLFRYLPYSRAVAALGFGSIQGPIGALQNGAPVVLGQGFCQPGTECVDEINGALSDCGRREV